MKRRRNGLQAARFICAHAFDVTVQGCAGIFIYIAYGNRENDENRVLHNQS